MGQDEVGTPRTLTAYRAIIDRLIASHRGRIFNTAGDSLVADFVSAVDAVQCAVAVQDAIAKENADRPANQQMCSASASTSATLRCRVTTCSVMPSISRLGWRLLRKRWDLRLGCWCMIEEIITALSRIAAQPSLRR